MNGDPYLYPGTLTLRNRYGIRDPDQLETAERVLSRFAMRAPLDPPPDMAPEGLAQIHRHIFGRIYPWAGEFRTVNLEKIVTESRTVEFERGPLVAPNVRRLFGELRDDNYLRGLDAGTFAYRAAVYMEDLNFIHPFREGNGRAQRLFLECLARQAGHNLDLSLIDERGWMDGAIQSHRQPIDGAHDIMTRTIERALTEPSTEKDSMARALERARRHEELGPTDHDRGDERER